MSRMIRIAICTAFLLTSAGLASAHHVKCSQDLDNDGRVDGNDTRIIDDAYGSAMGAAPYDERADFNQDGFVNKEDRADYKHCKPPALERRDKDSR